MVRFVIPLAAVAMVPFGAAQAQGISPATGNLEVRLEIVKACEVSGSNSGAIGSAVLDFGTWGVLLDNIDADTDTGTGADAVEVLCNSGVGYTVAFDAGENATDIADRAMKHTVSNDTVAYQLYSDSNRQTVLDSISGTGTGVPQTITVYGRIPPQATPQVGSYRDVVVITVAF